MSIRGMCVLCVKQGIKNEIELEIEDSNGRKVIKRSCGNHSQKKQCRSDKAYYRALALINIQSQDPLEWI